MPAKSNHTGPEYEQLSLNESETVSAEREGHRNEPIAATDRSEDEHINEHTAETFLPCDALSHFRLLFLLHLLRTRHSRRVGSAGAQTNKITYSILLLLE